MAEGPRRHAASSRPRKTSRRLHALEAYNSDVQIPGLSQPAAEQREESCPAAWDERVERRIQLRTRRTSEEETRLCGDPDNRRRWADRRRLCRREADGEVRPNDRLS